MKWLVLYLRSRRVAAGAGVALAAVVGLGLLAQRSPHAHLLLAVFAVAVVTAVTSTGLAAPDTALDRTAALDWRVGRAAHVIAIAVLAMTLAVVAGPPVVPEVAVRNAAGLAGLAALGATVLGGGLAWCLPMVWTVAAVSVMLAGGTPPAPLVTWLVQPAGTTAATVAAMVLGCCGLVVYAVRGSRAQ